MKLYCLKQLALWIWQLPQHLIGLALICLLKADKREWKHNEIKIAYWQFIPKGRFGNFISGVSLGEYIILKPGSDYDKTIPHEYGHSIQSRAWGPLYLPAVGVPSAVFNNLWDRLFHKDWTSARRNDWYYSRYPEKQADLLGDVVRG